MAIVDKPTKSENHYEGVHFITYGGVMYKCEVYWSDDFGDPEEPTVGWAFSSSRDNSDGEFQGAGFFRSGDALIFWMDYHLERQNLGDV